LRELHRLVRHRLGPRVDRPDAQAVAGDAVIGRADSPPNVSVLVPVFDEAAGIRDGHREITSALAESGLTWEIVYVDDGSSDGSPEILDEIAAADPRTSVVHLAYNVGQQSAMYAALPHCSGEVTVTLDADLQCPPACVPALARKVLSGYDLVGGIRSVRRDDLFGNRIPSAIGRWLINRALGVRQIDFGAVKAYSRRLVDLMLSAHETIPVLPAMGYRFARRWTEIPVEHVARRFGRSKWSLYARAELYADIYTLYARRPFAPMLASGLLFLATAFVVGAAVLLYRALVGHIASGLIFFFVAFLFASGLYFVTTAMLGEFVVRALRRRVGGGAPVARVTQGAPNNG
jgi:glycosyltransferase involved in cell wall biosynthesis